MAVDEKKLEAIVSQQIELAKSHNSEEGEGDRAKALDYFFGRMDKYIPPEVNRSKVVSRDVADAMGWMLPPIMRTFTASDKMAIAEPVDEDDVEFCREATDGLNYVFWKDNKGYEIVYSGTWDSLLHGNAIVKTFYDQTPIYKVSFHSGLDEDQVALLLQEDENGDAPEVLAQTERPTVDPMTGEQVALYDLKIKRKKASGRFVIEVIPRDRFLIHEDAVSTDDAAFSGHWEPKTRSDLIEMGYDKDDVFSIPEANRNETPEDAARRLFAGSNDAADESMEVVDYYECFIRIDVDDDGEAELVRACYGGSGNKGNGGVKRGSLLHWEVWEDENPFDDIPCEPVPHRLTARSLADETMDRQEVKTVLERQGLNNIYATNNPQRHAKGKFDNTDELVNPTFGGVVFGDANSEVVDLSIPFVANHVFEALAYQDEVIQRRTGISRQGMALDPDKLQNQTATANQNQTDAQFSQAEQIARNMSEWGWKKVFRKLLRLMVKHQGPRTLMMNGKAIRIDPRHWNADMDVTINVGLGTGSRDRDLVHLQGILQTQMLMTDRFMAAGATEDAIDMLPKILRTMTKMAESAGIRNPEDFYPEYTQEKLEQLKKLAAAPKPDPAVELEKVKAQTAKEIEAFKVQASMQTEQAQIQAQAQKDQMQMQREIEKERAQMEADVQVKMAEMQADAQLKAQEFDFEREKMAFDAAEKDKDRRLQLMIKQMEIDAQARAAAEANQIKREDGERNAAVKMATAKQPAKEK
jgi:hypothetical protein